MVSAALQELLQLFGIVGDVATWQTFLSSLSSSDVMFRLKMGYAPEAQ